MVRDSLEDTLFLSTSKMSIDTQSPHHIKEKKKKT